MTLTKSNWLTSVAVVASCVVLGATVCVAEQSSELDSSAENSSFHTEMGRFLSEAKPYISTRYRFEFVDQEGLPNNANASTLRTRLGVESGSVYGFSSKIEFEDVTQVGNSSYNDTVNGETDYPVVADPSSTEVNVAYLRYQNIPQTVLTAGRQVLTLDDLRFVGDVGWRQNNQTFDAITLTNTSVENLNLFYSFVGNVNRIFGERSDKGDITSKTHLTNIRYEAAESAILTTYAYLLDLEDANSLSSATFGLRLNGSTSLSDSLSLLYDGQYAFQQEYADNPADYEAHYYHAQTGVKSGPVVAKIGYESLGSDSGEIGFSTPLATLHKWNGWADQFLTTPSEGLQDAYALVGYSVDVSTEYLESISLTAVYHQFTAENNSTKYGEEWNAEIVGKICPIFSLGLKYANYQASNFASDTEKLILSAELQLQ